MVFFVVDTFFKKKDGADFDPVNTAVFGINFWLPAFSQVIEDRAILLAASRNRPLEASLLPRTLPHGPDRPSVVVGVEIELGAIKRHFARFAPCFWRVGVWPTDAFQKIYFLASRIGRGGGPNRAMSLYSPHLNLLSYPVYTDTSC